MTIFRFPRARPRHPDMVGVIRGEFTVIALAPAVTKAARWRCTCPQGHVRYLYTSQLKRPDANPRCKVCRVDPAP